MKAPHLIPDQTDKWQRMLAIVSQHPILLQTHLAGKLKTLFISRLLAENLLLFLLQYMGLMFSTLTFHPAPLAFATGTACAFIFLRGSSILPGIWLGSFFAYYFAHASLLLSGGCATIYTLQAFLLLKMSYRYIVPTLIFYRVRTFFKFIFCTSILTAISGGLLALFCHATLKTTATLQQLWLQLWLANLNGILILSSTIITWDAYFSQWDVFKKINKYTAATRYGILLMIVSTLVFSQHFLLTLGLAFAMLIIAIIISLRFGWVGAIASAFLSALLLSLATYLEAPIVNTSFAATTFTILQLLLCVQVTAGLMLSILRKKMSF